MRPLRLCHARVAVAKAATQWPQFRRALWGLYAGISISHGHSGGPFATGWQAISTLWVSAGLAFRGQIAGNGHQVVASKGSEQDFVTVALNTQTSAIPATAAGAPGAAPAGPAAMLQSMTSLRIKRLDPNELVYALVLREQMLRQAGLGQEQLGAAGQQLPAGTQDAARAAAAQQQTAAQQAAAQQATQAAAQQTARQQAAAKRAAEAAAARDAAISSHVMANMYGPAPITFVSAVGGTNAAPASTSAQVATTPTAATPAVASTSIAPRTRDDYWAAHIAQFRGRYLPDGPDMRPNCGPAAVTIALRLIGLDIPGYNGQNSEAVLDTARIMATGQNNTAVGTTDSELERAIEGSGARWSESTNLNELLGWVRQGIPVVLAGNPINAWDRRYSSDQVHPFDGGHWVTVSGYDASTGYYVVNDPLSQIGPIYVSAAELQTYNSSHGGLGIAVFR